jgi:LPS export ABC transporter protein LptC
MKPNARHSTILTPQPVMPLATPPALRRWVSESLTHAPLILMAILALASFALFKQTPSAPDHQPAPSASSRDDYFLKHFLATEFLPTGAARSHISGVSARHNPILKTLTISNIDFVASSQSALFHGSAKVGTVSDDGKHITLTGQAVVDKQGGASTSNPSVHFESEQITVRQDPDTVEASAPVRINSGNTQMAAESLRYEAASKETQLKGRVRMVIEGK